MKLTQSGMSEVTAAMRDSMRSQKNFPPGPVKASDAVSVHPSESLESTMGARMGGGGRTCCHVFVFSYFILFMFFWGATVLPVGSNSSRRNVRKSARRNSLEWVQDKKAC